MSETVKDIVSDAEGVREPADGVTVHVIEAERDGPCVADPVAEKTHQEADRDADGEEDRRVTVTVSRVKLCCSRRRVGVESGVPEPEASTENVSVLLRAIAESVEDNVVETESVAVGVEVGVPVLVLDGSLEAVAVTEKSRVRDKVAETVGDSVPLLIVGE